MAKQVYMDIQKVKGLAQSLGTYGDALKAFGKAQATAYTMLAKTGFDNNVGGTLLNSYETEMKPQIDQLTNKLYELQRDVLGAISNYETGDTSGSNRFR